MSFNVALAGESMASGRLSIETNISSTNASIQNMSVTNANIGQLSTTIFNPASVTTTTLDANIGQIGTLTVYNPIAVLPVNVLNCCTINASVKNVCNISAIHISASQITCDNLQPLLTAGTNISIVDGVISAGNDALLPSIANFSTINSHIINSSFFVSNLANMFHTSTVSISSNHASFVALTANNLSTGDLNFGSNLSYNPFTKHLDVNTAQFVTENDERPVTSWAVYKEFVNRLSEQVNNIMTVHFYKLSDSEVTLVATQVPAGGNNTIFRVDFTPQYLNSKIAIEICYGYSVGGNGTDQIITDLMVGTNNNQSQLLIQRLIQKWNDNNGGGTRSGASGSIMGVYDNADTLGKFHRVYLKIDNTSNDLWELSNITLPAIKITEILEIETINNPNIRIGSGNISCGNISASNISCAQITVSQFIVDGDITTNEGLNAGGGLITTGFSPNGIAALSRIRMAGGASLFNSADTEWDGTTFNISMRQANKNFKVSISGQEYLQVNVSNTSTRSLIVNGNLSVSGTFGVDSLALNSLVLNGLSTFQSARFNNNVSILGHLNSCNVSIHGNVSIVGFATISGNLSMLGNISARHISAPNLSTASLVAGQNISILNGSISAFIQGGNDIDVRNLHVDEDVQIVGLLNVSETSTFKQSLNVCNIIYAGDAGKQDGSVVVYSQQIGNNWATKFDDDKLNMSATGTAQEANIWVGGNKTLSVTATGVNISGVITASQFNFSLDNVSFTNLSSVNSTATNGSFTNLSSVNITADSIVAPNVQPTLTAGVGINISGNVISGTETLTAGSNISIFNNIVSTTPNINSSVHTAGTMNTSILNASDIDAPLGEIDNLSSINFSATTGTITTLRSTTQNATTTNTSTLNCSNINVSNKVSCVNLSLTNSSHNLITTGTIRATTSNGTTMNCSNINVSAKVSAVNLSITNSSHNLITTGTIRSTTSNGTTMNASNINISTKLTTTNISATNITATSITAPNVQPTLTAGTGINISGNVISGTETLTSGNNISIFNNVVSTTPNINVSNLSVINGSFSALTCSGNISFPIGFALYRDFTGLLNVCDIQIKGLFGSIVSATTGNFSKINVSNVSFTGIGPKMSMGGLGQIFGVGTYTGIQANLSQLNASNASIGNISATHITATSISAPNLSTASLGLSNDLYILNNVLEVDFSSATDAATAEVNSLASALASNVSTTSVSAVFGTIGLLTINTLANAPTINVSTLNASTISASSITAPNVQPTLTAGSGINISGTTISTTQTLVAGNNISIVGNDISTTTTINSSVHNAETMNTSIINASDIDSILGEIDNLSSINLSSSLITTNTLTTTGAVGIGINNPERFFHVRGADATWRLDRDRPSPALQIHRYNTNFVGAPLKGFVMGVEATSANNGFFFINDYAQNVTGSSTQRFRIENDGQVTIINKLSVGGGIIADNFSVADTNGNTIIGGTLGVTGLITTTNMSLTNMSATLITPTTIRAATSNGTTMNCSNINISTKIHGTNLSITNISATLITTGTIRATTSNGTTMNCSNINISTKIHGTNLSITNISATLITTGTIRATTSNGTTMNCSNINISTKITAVNLSITNSSHTLITTGTIRATTSNGTTMNASNVNISTKLTVPNISSARANFTTDIITPKVTATALNTSSSLNFNINNVPSMELGSALFMYTDIQGTNGYFTGNLSAINGSFTTLSASSITAPNVQPTLTAGTGINISGTTISTTQTLVAGNNIQIVGNDILTTTTINSSVHNAETMNTSIINASDIDSILGEIDNLSSINISATNITATSVVASNVQPLLTAGANINISNNVISSTATLTAGNNISILNGIVSLNPNINISNISVINGSFSALTCTGNISFPIGFGLYRDFTGLMNVCDIQIKGLFGATFSATTGNFSKINVSNVSFTGIGPKMSMGGLGEIFGVGTYRGLNANVSQVNASNISTINLSATNITATSITAPNVQPTLTAGNNIQLVGNTISTTTTINSSVHNAQTINTSNINVSLKVHTTNLSTTNFSGGLGTFSGNLTLNGLLTLNQQPRFLARYQGATSPLVVGTNVVLSYNTIVYQVGTGYSTTTFTYTVPVAGLYFFMCSYNTEATTCEVYLEKNGASLQRTRKTGATNADSTLYVTVISQCVAGNTIRCVNRLNSMRLQALGTLPQGLHQFSGTRIG